MTRVAIIDKEGHTVDPEDLTDTGLGDTIFGCDRLKERCEELRAAMLDDDLEADPETALDDQDPDMGDCGSDFD